MNENLCTYTGKSTISKILKEKGFGVRWCTPPYDLRDLRSEFDANPALKTAFYALGNYIAAMQVASVLRRHNVVMDRWLSAFKPLLHQYKHFRFQILAFNSSICIGTRY